MWTDAVRLSLSLSAIPLAALLLAAPAGAKVVASGSDHYALAHEARSDLSAGDMWERVLDVGAWWDGAHTYSGSAENLSLEAGAGGLWREDWRVGGQVNERAASVVHGRVLLLQPPSGDSPGKLVLDAPFGPLQARAVSVVWTVSVAPDGEGSRVRFDEIASGTERSGLDALAPAVDGVKQAAMESLVGG